ncbi:MAG: class I SAM-dependent methyltransferase [Deltaproteobacteria bacterium]|nr:class I SAM-dependent methyltransferase [Deltaproteobacteria bacterium]
MSNTNDDDDDDGDDDADLSRLYPAAAAFCRGMLGPFPSDEIAVRTARRAGLRLHRFKRAMVLARVQRVLSVLKGLAPASLLDVGTGRGVFLWPFLEAFPELPVSCVDTRTDRVDDLRATARGGFPLLSAREASACALPFSAGEFDVVTALEVLEHIEDVQAAANEIVRVARRFIVVTVPSQPDNNPEHIRLFTKETLEALFANAGAARVNVDGVRNHFVVVVTR